MGTIPPDAERPPAPGEAPSEAQVQKEEAHVSKEGVLGSKSVKVLSGAERESEEIQDIEDAVKEATREQFSGKTHVKEKTIQESHVVTAPGKEVKAEAKAETTPSPPQKRISFTEVAAREKLTHASDATVAAYIEKLKVQVQSQDPALEMPPDIALKIIDRFQHVKKAVSQEFETTIMTDYDILHHAFFIELELPKMTLATDGVLRRRDTGLSRTLQYDTKSHTVYILARHKISKLQGEGTFKKVVAAAGVPLKSITETVQAARVFTKVIQADRQDYANTKREIAIAQDLGFGNIRAVCEHSYTNKSKKESLRISMIYDRTKGDVYEVVVTKHDSVSIDRKYSIMQEVVDELSIMHGKGYFHRDMKAANILIGQKAIITDFGLSRKLGEEDKTSSYGYFYGTPAYTAPEFLGIRNFQGNHFAVDTFATGIAMYEMRFGHLPSWSLLIHSHALNILKMNENDLQECQFKVKKEIRKEVEEKVEPLLKKLLCGKALTAEEKYDLVMYQMLRLDPNDRLNCDPNDTERESAGAFIQRVNAVPTVLYPVEVSEAEVAIATQLQAQKEIGRLESASLSEQPLTPINEEVRVSLDVQEKIASMTSMYARVEKILSGEVMLDESVTPKDQQLFELLESIAKMVAELPKDQQNVALDALQETVENADTYIIFQGLVGTAIRARGGS